MLQWQNSDCALIAVFERYGKNNNVAFGLVQGEIIKEGYEFSTDPNDNNSYLDIKNNGDVIKTMKDFNVSSCFYGHLHADSHKEAIERSNFTLEPATLLSM